MHLSKVFIDFRKPKNIYQIHQDLWTLFPGQEDKARSFLFRVEQQQAGAGASILMQSEIAPSAGNEQIKLLGTREYPLTVLKGQRLRFLLIANPVKTIKDQRERKNKKGVIKSNRVPLIKEEDQQNWLERKLQSSAQIDSLMIRPCHPMYFYKKDQENPKGYGGKIVPVTFEGILIVQEPDTLTQQVKQGIGPAKAFGCGLLSVARI
ncbi:type I-E CRISPR-associated protein Cas6/Cse3/CasE [Methylobacter marinus]|uniref:type I-E CRISPR-associated protein Cas6/Cse3/CasE n=1 Tax=Methylobacter marinus TaxID=34058 RepID=UPI00036CC167|nr:type I-E CRISPR-associated protein Cas6/Cse3/CasE [Methylobacter marinus]